MKYRPCLSHGQRVDGDPYFTLMTDQYGDGFVHCGDGVLVVPLTDDGCVLMAMERSPAFDREVLGLVGGEVEEGELLEQTANRELQEELGWRAERIDFLGEIHPFKYLASRHFVFLARGLMPSKLRGDEKHPINERKIKLDGLFKLCMSGELQDAPSIAALCMAQEYLEKEAT
jgi:ADP-ribose diphosphatase